MAIGQMGVVGGGGDLAGFADLVEDAEHHDDTLRAAFLMKPPHGFDLDLQHVPALVYEM